MENLPTDPTDVKHILAALDPHTGNFAVYPATHHEFLNAPVAAGNIDPFSLLYRDGEIYHPEAFAHETGFVARHREDSTVQLPLKDLPRFPFPSSRPADFQAAIIDLDQPLEFRGIPATDVLVMLWRPVQRREITKQHISLLNRLFKVRQRKSEDPDPHHLPGSPGQPHDRHLHVVPAGDPGTKTASPQLLLSLFRIPVRALAWPLSLGLPFGACVLYLITRQFPAPRRQATEKLYCDAGARQLTAYMTLIKPILLRNASDHLRDQAKRLKTTFRAVRYWHTLLRNVGLVVPVSPPKPGVRTSRRLVARNEKERRETLPLARRVRARPRQPHKALHP